jgi:hypothetical protein
MSAGSGSSYQLVGGSDLTKHVGHKIEVKGSLESGSSMSGSGTTGSTGSTSGTSGTGTSTTGSAGSMTGSTGSTGGAGHMAGGSGMWPRLRVTSVRHISPTCS